jgi:thioredoxin 1
MMKKQLFKSMIILAIMIISCQSNSNESKNNQNINNMETKGRVVHITTQQFKEKVFNYDNSKTWKYEGELPAIIDFYADWCGPCKMVSPVLEQLAKEYDGKLVIYKVDTEKEKDLATAFGISSIPTLIFVPKNGQPQAAMGALPKETFVKAINDILLVN